MISPPGLFAIGPDPIRPPGLALLGCLTVLVQAAFGQVPAIDSIVEDGVRQGVYPGAVVLAGNRDRVLYARGYGHYTWSPQSPVPTPDSTLWDLASLTKVAATLSGVIWLWRDGRLDLDRPVAEYLPRFTGGGRDRVTVRMLLTHRSGLPAYVEFFRLAPSRDSAISLLYDVPLRHPPGSVEQYSDLNFLLLGLLVERVSGSSLDRVARAHLFGPAGMTSTRFKPGTEAVRLAAPTGVWRGHPVAGVVNDRNAARFGGVAGHAGLFATGRDLARFARLWLAGGVLDGVRLLDPRTDSIVLTPASDTATRLLGWERPPEDRRDTWFGHRVAASAYGHTGWTGTALWIDPTRDRWLVFLTNRSYAPRVARSITVLRTIRSALSDAVADLPEADLARSAAK